MGRYENVKHSAAQHRPQKQAGSKGLHPNNLHRHGYDFAALVETRPSLAAHVRSNEYQNASIDFADPAAVKALNGALLQRHYGIVGWDIPEGFLCPPIPGRVDYLHYVADLLGVGPSKNASIQLLDIGTGANGIYALLAAQVYGWHSTASDIDPLSIENVAKIVGKNPEIAARLELRLQTDKSHIFTGIIQEGEHYDVSVCNPPFHASLEDALKGSQKKLDNLAESRGVKRALGNTPKLNFGGQKAELWCSGGEIRFLRKMLKESKTFASQCRWFTTLVSKSENLQPCMKLLRKLDAVEVKEIEMKQGNKITRILAWRFEAGI